MIFGLDLDRVRIKRLLAVQFAATCVVPLLFLFGGVHVALSALIGGAIALVACAWQAIKFFGPYRAQDPERLLSSILMSEAVKFVLVGALFAMVFHGVGWLHPAPVFIGFIIVYITPWLAVAAGLETRKQS